MPDPVVVDLAAIELLARDPAITVQVVAAVQPAVGGAKRRAPRLTGKVAAHIGTRVGSDERGAYVDFGVFGRDTFYWRFVEHGTRDRRAHPFLRPAIDDAGLSIRPGS